MTLHPAGRQVDGLAVRPAPRDVRHRLRGDIAGEVPRRRHCALQCARHRSLLERLDLDATQDPVRQARAVELAIEVSAAHNAPLDGSLVVGGHDQRRVVLGDRLERRLLLDGRGGVDRGVLHERLLIEADLPARRIVARRDHVPLARDECLPTADGLRLTRPIAQQQGRRPQLVDDQGEAALGALRPLADQRLPPLLGRGRPDHRLKREVRQRSKDGAVRHEHVGSRVDLLLSPPVLVAPHPSDHLLLESGTVRVEIPVNDPHEVGPVRRRPVTAHHEPYRVIGSRADLVAVADNLLHASNLNRRP